jgi:opacity protein-like surface antigen
MKRLVFICLASVFLFAGTAHAQSGTQAGELDGWIVEFALGLASEPAGDFGRGYGLGVGISQSFDSLFPGAGNSTFTDNLLLRADLNYFSWDDKISIPGASAEIEFTRVPLFLGGRYVFPQKLGNKVLMYADGGIEISFDEAEAAACIAAFPPFILTSTCTSKSDSEVNLGITPGFGLVVPITDRVNIGANLRYHLISDDYFSGMATVGIRLGN